MTAEIHITPKNDEFTPFHPSGPGSFLDEVAFWDDPFSNYYPLNYYECTNEDLKEMGIDPEVSTE